MEERQEREQNEQLNKRLRVSSSYDESIHEKLDRLAVACGMSRTTLQTEIVKIFLSSENLINYVQDKNKNKSRFRVVPTRIGNELKFIFAEKVVQKKK